ncbi:MAG: phosphate ABC transporter permease PstA [Acidimicrobiales bacterium]
MSLLRPADGGAGGGSGRSQMAAGMVAGPLSRPLNRGIAAVAGSWVAIWALFRFANGPAPLGFAICWYVAAVGLYWLIEREAGPNHEARDRVTTVLLGTAAAAAFVPLIFILYLVFSNGLPTLVGGFPNFFTRTLEVFGPLDNAIDGGGKHAVLGTLQQVGLATVVSVPVAILTAVYLNEIGGRMAPLLRFIVDAMSGVPSIVAGLFVYTLWILQFGKGFSGAAGSAALAVLMLPTVTRTAEEILRTVPGGLREAALALGAPEWRMIVSVVLPTARSGLVTGAILGVARAVGETAPVLLTARGSRTLNVNPFADPQDDLPLFVYSLIRTPNESLVDVAWAGALVLVLLVLVLFIIARVVGGSGPAKR